jgi:hypothetical protein
MTIGTDEGCLSGCHWNGGSCSRCGNQLRCMCGRFVTIDALDKHINEQCPVTRGVLEDDEAA